MEEPYLRGQGKGVTNMDEHGRTVYEGGGVGVTNMDERERTWSNIVEHCKTFGQVWRYSREKLYVY